MLPAFFSKTEIRVASGLTLVLALVASLFVHPLAGFGVVALVALFVLLLHAPWVGVVAVAFLLPFERIGGYEGLGFTIRPSQIVLAMTILAWGFVLLRERKPIASLKRNPITWAVLAFIMVNVAGLTQSPNLERSLMVLGISVFTMLLVWVVPVLLTNERRLRATLMTLLITAGLVSVFGLFQFIGDVAGLPAAITGLREQYTKIIFGFPRVQSTSLEPLYFANFLLLPIALAASFILERKWILRPWLLWSILTLTSVNLILTVSRGGYLAVAALGVILGLFYIRRLLNWKVLGGGIVGLAIVIVAAFQFLGFGDTFQMNREAFTDHVVNVFSGASYVERIETMQLAVDMFTSSPLIGRGPGSFGPLASFHPTVEPETGWAIVNNEPIELLAETGLLGLFAILAMGVILLIRSWHAAKQSRSAFLRAAMIATAATLIAYAIQYQTFSVLYIMHIWFTIGLVVAVQQLTRKTP